ncbi:MAG: aminodeoxychorismate lyase [Phenylobacterium zucineum]|nr:MAG: aminodeoxychorismate lyase [Phenylobacterium zucineum]
MSGGAVFGLVLILLLVGALWEYGGPGPAAKSGQETLFELRHGASLPEIASSLKRTGVIGSQSVFMAAAQVTGSARKLKAGEYAIKSHASIRDILSDIASGKTVRRQITIPEGLTSEAVVGKLATEPLLSGVAPTPAEGSILPETYEFNRGEDRAQVLKRMMDAQDRLMALLWQNRQADLPFQTPNEAITLASIVEKETGKASERPRVAAVFLNRLRMGMRLQSDPTVIYGISQGRALGRGLRASELAEVTVYNTYQISGLPPTPIANPGREALVAVLDPPKTDELYFVADGTGGHVFASTLEEHQRNVAKWRRIEKSRAASEASGGKL